MAPYDRRHETPAERLDRNWNELLQEFRVAQTGIQILFGFLLILPFQPGFTEIGGMQRWSYLFIFACVTISTMCILAPVMAHRLLFRRRRKERLVDLGNNLAKVALGFLGAALVAAVWLIVSVVSTPVMAGIWLVATLLLMVALWVVVPLRMDAGDADPDTEDAA